jgi:hypothetical protein
MVPIVSSRSFRRTLLLAIPLLPLVFTFKVESAGPRLILVHGEALGNPIVLDDWQENINLVQGVAGGAEVRSEELDGRPYFELAFYSGPYWTQYVNNGKSVGDLRPEGGDQRWRFYPAVDGYAAALRLDAGRPRRISTEGAAILSRHGIPTRLSPPSSMRSWLAWLLVGVVVMATLVAMASLLRRRRVSPDL